MAARRVNLLWFDDDLHPLSEGPSSRRGGLQPWLRYLRTVSAPSGWC
jgi:hypothetical protein